jgi:hypothetical protein
MDTRFPQCAWFLPRRNAEEQFILHYRPLVADFLTVAYVRTYVLSTLLGGFAFCVSLFQDTETWQSCRTPTESLRFDFVMRACWILRGALLHQASLIPH